MKKVFLVVLIAILVVSCKRKGSPVTATESVDNFSVVKLFVVDGITVYRFNDSGNYVYFTNGKGEVQSKIKHSRYDPASKMTVTTTETTKTICNGNVK